MSEELNLQEIETLLENVEDPIKESIAGLMRTMSYDSHDLIAENSEAFQQNADIALAELQSGIETLLFLADRPLSRKSLMDSLEVEAHAFDRAVQLIQERLSNRASAIELTEVNHGFQLRTKPEKAHFAKHLIKLQTQRLSSGAMETLAVIAYKQPALKDDIDKVRGVDSSHFVRILLEKGFVEMTGRSDLPGRPIQYSTTPRFLEVFGLKDLNGLPPLHEIEKMVPTSEVRPDDEDPRVKQMRKLVHEMKEAKAEGVGYDPKEDEKILAEIREKVSAIRTSTPSLDEQKDEQKRLVKEARLNAETATETDAQAEFAAPMEATVEVPETEVPTTDEPSTDEPAPEASELN